MMKLKNIIQHIEEIVPLSLQESYDNSGLLIGSLDMKINAALLTLDCTEAVVDEAIAKKCNLIVAHHPIIFSGLKKINNQSYIERVIYKAIKNNIAIYACHTNLDNLFEGVNNKIADKIDLINRTILKPMPSQLKKLYTYVPHADAEKLRDAIFNVGGGEIGNYSSCSYSTEGKGTFKANQKASPYIGEIGKLHTENETKLEIIYSAHLERNILHALKSNHPYEEVAYELITLDNQHPQHGAGLYGELKKPMKEIDFLKLIKKIFNLKMIKHTPLLGQMVHKITLCGGSGSFLLPDALKVQADVFISADFKYHQYFDAENRILIADIGHFETEQYTPEIFYEILSKKFSNFALHLSTVNTNPVNYL